jgi:hypothetical protein
MEKVDVIDLAFGICQPCPGVWYYPETPTELLEEGVLLSMSDFHDACRTTGKKFGEGTYAFRQLIFSIEQQYLEQHDRHVSYTDTYYGLKSPYSNRKNSFYIETQKAHDMYRNGIALQVALIGYGFKTLKILAEVIFDNSAPSL